MLNLLGVLAASGGGGGGAYESIATATGTGSSGTITFSSIPSTYKHLQIRGLARADASPTAPMWMYLKLNSTTGYTYHNIRGNGATASAAAATARSNAQLAGGCADPTFMAANILAASITDIIDYASTTKLKTIRCFAGVDPNGTDGAIALSSALATGLDVTAVDSVSLIAPSGNWTTQTVFSLYGIKGA